MDGFALELISLNTRGLRDYRKRGTVFNWLKKHTHKNAVILFFYKKLTVSKGTKGSGKRSGEVKSGMHMVLTIAKVFS